MWADLSPVGDREPLKAVCQRRAWASRARGAVTAPLSSELRRLGCPKQKLMSTESQRLLESLISSVLSQEATRLSRARGRREPLLPRQHSSRDPEVSPLGVLQGPRVTRPTPRSRAMSHLGHRLLLGRVNRAWEWRKDTEPGPRTPREQENPELCSKSDVQPLPPCWHSSGLPLSASLMGTAPHPPNSPGKLRRRQPQITPSSRTHSGA